MSIVGTNIIKELGTPKTRILHGIDLVIEDHEFVSISGRSGSGKSTLLYLLSTLDIPTQGEVEIDGKKTSDFTTEEIHRFRNLETGFIFQFHYLLPELNALENVLLPARHIHQHQAKKQFALEMLEQFGISDKQQHYPAEMSGGEQQRVAIARSLIMRPSYLFADEPTGNLDSHNAANVMHILQKINQDLGTTILLVTHDTNYAQIAHRKIFLSDGHLVKAL